MKNIKIRVVAAVLVFVVIIVEIVIIVARFVQKKPVHFLLLITSLCILGYFVIIFIHMV